MTRFFWTMDLVLAGGGGVSCCSCERHSRCSAVGVDGDCGGVMAAESKGAIVIGVALVEGPEMTASSDGRFSGAGALSMLVSTSQLSLSI